MIIACFTLSNVIYASFPVNDNVITSEVSVNTDELSSTIAPPAELHFGGLILGLLLGIIGVGLAYIFSQNPDFRRNAWYGFGIWIIIYLLLFMPVA